MKKILFYFRVILFLSVFLLFNQSFIRAQSSINVSSGNIWTEYISNPLFGGALDGTTRGYYPCAIKVGTTYYLWYGDGTNTRHATNTAANFSGTTFPAPVVTGLTAGSYHPRVLHNAAGWTVGGTYYAGPFLMYSTTGADWNLSPKIYHSADGDTWTYIGDCAGVNSYGGNTSIYNFDVLYEGGTTWKAYTDNGFGYIQYYISTDGKNWVGTAVNITGSNLQTWETFNSFTSPHVIKVDGYYLMFYGSGPTNNNQALGMAISTDGQTFIKSGCNPIFTTSGTPPSWRNDRSYTPFVLQDGSNWLMYFTGKSTSGGVYSIGYATNTGLFKLIQDAVNAALAGYTINVAAGTYNEAITINKGVSILGAGAANSIIDASGKLANAVSITTASGNVKLDGFKIYNSALSSGNHYQIVLSGGSNGSTVEICNNTIVGAGDANVDYGFYSGKCYSNLIFRNNTISNCATHSIFLERLLGTSDIKYNNITSHPNAGPAIGLMTYKNTGDPTSDYEITTKQWVHNNTINANGSSGIMFIAPFGWSYNQYLGGKYTNIEISNNIITNVGDYGKGIQLESDGDNGGIYNAVITGNNISHIGALGTSRGIRMLGNVIDATITNNIIIGFYRGVWQSYSWGQAGVPGPSGNALNNNSITNCTISADNQYSTPALNAINNWWGTIIESEILAKLSGNVLYNPWTGSLEAKTITNADLNTAVDFTTANTSLTFTSLPPATNATVTVQRIESSNPPTGVPGYPQSAGNGLPLYLMISATGLTNYTFSVTVVVDVSNINGFNPNTEVMYFSTASSSWVGIEGVYSPSAKTFTFTTDHFTPFGFVNPTNPNDIYMSQVTTDPVNTQKWYPAFGMGDPAPTPDWKYTNIGATFYVVPTGTTGMFSSKFAVVWDKSKANLTVTAGDYWTSQQYYGIDSSVGNNGRYWVNVASTDLTNQVPGSGKYLAKLVFTNIKPGYIPVSIDGTDFRYYSNDEQQGVYVTTHPGKILFYLGDFAKPGPIETMGDGRIEFEDITLFSAAYWSINGTHPSYKFKYDIGPTNANGSYWALPTPDGRIEFEDLNIFAIGYGKTGSGQLPDNPGDNKMKVSTLAMKYENGFLKVPVKVSGVVRDFRAGSFEFGYPSSELEFAGFEKKGGFEGDDNFMLSKAENNKIMLDAAIVGAEKDGMNGEQVIMNLLFTEKQSGNHSVNIITARARNSSNLPIEIIFDGSNGASSEIPTTFTLNQNYPNPFNPSTTIKYGLPKDVKVSIVVYDVLGRKVMTLVNDVQKAGYHSVEINAVNLASGTYFYRIIAGDFTSIKKMVLLK